MELNKRCPIFPFSTGGDSLSKAWGPEGSAGVQRWDEQEGEGWEVEERGGEIIFELARRWFNGLIAGAVAGGSDLSQVQGATPQPDTAL